MIRGFVCNSWISVIVNIFLNPNKILKSAGIEPGMGVADFGAGTGFFSIEAAKMVGENGKVWALDIMPRMIDVISSKAKMMHLKNIVPMQVNLEEPAGSHLHGASCDAVIVSNILFQAEKKEDIVREAERILKPRGKLVLVEWVPNKLPNPKGLHPISKEETEKLVLQFSFKKGRELDAGTYHYALVFNKE